LRDGERADDIVRYGTAGVANDVSVSLLEPKDLRDVEAGIHAGDDRQLLGRWKRKLTLVKSSGVRLVVSQSFVCCAHETLLNRF
jgi:hypothetical protein